MSELKNREKNSRVEYFQKLKPDDILEEKSQDEKRTINHAARIRIYFQTLGDIPLNTYLRANKFAYV